MKFGRVLAVIIVISLLLGAAAYYLSSRISHEYIGNVKTGVFHRQGCSHLPCEKNRAYFSSKEDAVDAGYRRCIVCWP
ncbi:MAG: Ada metal-binding domain-containing protein [Armatimonadota bacterium]|nr:Ada metal-binding domain-containing protein [bacterium]